MSAKTVVSSPAAHALNEREGIWHTKSTFLELENKIRLSNQITVFCDVMCDVDFNMANNCLICDRRVLKNGEIWEVVKMEWIS